MKFAPKEVQPETKRIILTGASGFIGRALFNELSNKGHKVVSIHGRNPAQELEHEHYIWPHEADEEWGKIFEGTDAIVHMGDRYNKFEKTPIKESNEEAVFFFEATKNFFQAAVDAKVPKIIYVSSVKAICGTSSDQVLTELSPPNPTQLYGLLKLRTEKTLLELTSGSNTQSVILRFPLAFGGDSNGSFRQLFRLVDTPLPLPLAGLDNRRSLMSVKSFVSAINQVIYDKHYKEDGLFFVHDGAMEMSELVRILRRGLGRSKRLFALPKPLWNIFRKISKLEGAVDRFTDSLELSDEKFRQTFKWEPSKDLRNRLLETAKDYRHR